MTLPVLIFYLFGGMAIAASLGVAASRNPLTGAVWLLLALFSVAALFAWSGAHFLAAMQVLVYAGAVTVLFVFVIMLLSLTERELGRQELGLASWTGLTFVLLMLVALSAVAVSSRPSFPPVVAGNPGGVKEFGVTLLTAYVLPFEIISLLLLTAMAGAVMLTKRAQGGEAVASIQRIRAVIDARGSRAFRPDAALPEQHSPPARQAPSGGPGRGYARDVRDPGETL